MRKNRIRLTESQLHNVIKESVKRVLKETSLYTDDPHHYDEYYNDKGDWNHDASEEEIIASLNGGREVSPQRKKYEMDKSWDEYDRSSNAMQDLSQDRANRMYHKANRMFTKDNPYIRNHYDDIDNEDALSVINTGNHLYEPNISVNKTKLPRVR